MSIFIVDRHLIFYLELDTMYNRSFGYLLLTMN